MKKKIFVILMLLFCVPKLYSENGEISLEDIFLKDTYKCNIVNKPIWFKDNMICEITQIKESELNELSIHPAKDFYDKKVIISKNDLNIDNHQYKIISFIMNRDCSIALLQIKEVRGKNNGYIYSLYNFTKKSSEIVFAKPLSHKISYFSFAPDGNKFAYVYMNNVFVYFINERHIVPLTVDGNENLIYGCSAGDNANGLNTNQLAWNYKSNKLAFLKKDISNVKRFALINNIDSLYPKVEYIPYVKPGEQLPLINIVIADIDSSSNKILERENDNIHFEDYITNLTWNKYTGELYVQKLSREQNVMRIISINPQNFSEKLILTETDNAFLDAERLKWIKGGKEFIWVSEMDGWRKIYKYDYKGNMLSKLIKDNFDIDKIISIDEKNSIVYFTASPETTIYRFLYKVTYDKPRAPSRVKGQCNGTNSFSISPDHKYAFHIYSKFTLPPIFTIMNLENGEVEEVIEDNKALNDKLKKISKGDFEFIKIKLNDSITLDGWRMMPLNFDPNKKYPIIFHVYSMPAAQQVADNWKFFTYYFYLKLAQEGFIVMNIDAQGTPTLYGRNWRKVIYKVHGILPADQIAAATKILLNKYPYMDPERVNVYGWSGGGCISLHLLLRYPDIFKTAVPGAFIADHRYYHADFTERYLGLPSKNKKAYDKAAVVNYVKNLKGNLLIMHGTSDDNVNYQNSELLMRALINYGKYFFVMPYPTSTHNMKLNKKAQYHQHKMYLEFFKRCNDLQ